jgi:hypothetical protein
MYYLIVVMALLRLSQTIPLLLPVATFYRTNSVLSLCLSNSMDSIGYNPCPERVFFSRYPHKEGALSCHKLFLIKGLVVLARGSDKLHLIRVELRGGEGTTRKRVEGLTEAVDMNGRIQMQGGKNWILPK